METVDSVELTPVIQMGEVKPGTRTTEFWLALAALLCASVLLGLDKIDATVWVAVAAGVSGFYSVGRGLAKL